MVETKSIIPLPPDVGANERGDPRMSAQAYLYSLTSPNSRSSMTRLLGSIAHQLTGGQTDDFNRIPWDEVTDRHLIALRNSFIDKGLAPSTCNLSLIAAKSVLKHAYNAGIINVQAYSLVEQVKLVPNTTPPTGRMISPEEGRALFHACHEPGPRARRDAAMLAFFFGLALRRVEIASLCMDNLDLNRRVLYISGKRNRRKTFLFQPTLEALQEWLDIRTMQPGAIFCPIKKGGHIHHARHLAPSSIETIFKMRARKAGISDISLHDTRRTSVSSLLTAGIHISIIQIMVGHRSMQSTADYDRRDKLAIFKALSQVDDDYVPLYHRPPNDSEPCKDSPL